MLRPVYYIIDAEALNEWRASATNGSIILRIDILDQKALQTLYQQLQNVQAGFTFSLCLAVTEAFNKDSINNIIAFFFFPQYQQFGHEPVILVENRTQKGFETFSAALVEGAAQQGFIRIHLIEKNPDLIYTAEDKERLADDYRQALQNGTEKSFYLAVSDSSEMEAISTLLKEVESAFATDNEAVYNMQKENKALKEKVDELQYQLAVAEKEISHMSSHMAVLNSTSQAVSLQNYYNNEYEVLPRWYKQLGHVLKVISGKRTLHSLFDKKAKKYRT